MYDLTVIGGGAAGMFAAAVASYAGLNVLLLERNEFLGKKLRITGKGRCNITNDCSIDDALRNIPTGTRFLQSAFNQFSPQNTMRFFEHLGVPLVTERGGRVFPKSEKASDIVDALKRNLTDSGAICEKGRAARILVEEENLTVILKSGRKIKSKTVILATGGASYPATGSTGDGYEIAKQLGHKITPLRPSLVSLVADPEICERMQGLTLKNVKVRVFDGGKKPIFEDFGELLFTHNGVSGPLALSASAHIRELDKKCYYILLDLKPALDEKKLDNRILRDFEKYSNRDYANALGELFHKTMIPVIVEKSGIPPNTKVHSISRSQRQELFRLTKEFRIDIQSLGPIEEAVITSGGVDLREINPKTMESKIVKGLYFAGEIIDADAYTGGYNLQIAWSTAYAAANSAKDSC
jgi:predicted Rossmann fold flavoprotein